MEEYKNNPWFLLGKEFSKLDEKYTQNLKIKFPFISRSYLGKNEFMKLCNYANEKSSEVRTAKAKQAYVDDKKEYTEGEQMYIFYAGCDEL